MLEKIFRFLFSCKKQEIEEKKETSSTMVYVTIDWGGNPITTKGDGYILPRKAEMILNAKYYPKGTVGEWPCCPTTKEKLQIWKP